MPQLIQQYVSRQALQRPNHTAVVCKNERVPYGELDQLTNQLAHRLRVCGCRGSDRVAVLIPSSANAIFAMLGVLKADCVYVPIDPDDSADQIAAILNAAEPKVLIAARSKTALLNEVVAGHELPAGMQIGTLEAIALSDEYIETSFTGLDVLAAARTPLVYECKPTEPAVIRYRTRGVGQDDSNNRDGVVISHANVIYGIDWSLKYFQTNEHDRVAGDVPPRSDLVSLEVLGPLAAGAELHLVPTAARSQPQELAAFLRTREITQWISTPTSLNSLVQNYAVPDGDLPSLKHLIWTGEALSNSTLNSTLNHLRQRLPLTQFTQLYGVPETSIVSSYFTVPAGSLDDTAQLPIGRACEGVGLFVLDRNLQPVPLEEVGELYIGGVGLCSGYWRDRAQTAAAFVQHPILRQRLFKTGDLARIGFDGLVYLTGRATIQEEYEDCLTDGQQRVDRETVDRLAKRTDFNASPLKKRETIMFDRAVLQSQIAHLIADKLELDEPAVDTDLFDAGVLDSLSYVRLVVELQQEFGVQISLGEIDIDHFRTVEQIAEFLMQHDADLAMA